jgi:hypothetical protein
MNEGNGSILRDSSGNNNVGNFYGFPSVTWASGDYGTALVFPGSDSSQVGYVLSANRFSNLPVTLVYGIVVTQFPAIGNYPNNWFFAGSSQGLQLYNRDGVDISWDYQGGYQDLSYPTVNISEIHTFTIDGLGNWQMYKNGKKIVGAGANSGLLTANYFRLGPTNGPFSLSMKMNFVNIWNRILSQQEISYITAFPFCMFDPPDLDNSNYGLVNTSKGRVL